MRYKNFDQAALDKAYNNSLAVTNSSAILDDWNRRSEVLAARQPEKLDLRYGPKERNRIDYFTAGKDCPLLIFIHGGYWQMRAKETFRFLAEGPLAHGIDVAFIGYTLAPEASMEDIVKEIGTAISWLSEYRTGSPDIIISGWSAGGHLTALMQSLSATVPSIKGLLTISGIFDLEPIRQSYLNEKLNLNNDNAKKFSPILQVSLANTPCIVAYGTGELPELQNQSREYVEALKRAEKTAQGLPLADKNHFTILETLASADGELTCAVRELLLVK